MQTKQRIVVASSLLHLALLAAILHGPGIHVVPTRFPGTALGSRISLTYSPGRARTEATLAAPRPAPSKLTRPVKTPATDHTSPDANSPASAHPNGQAGGDALGTGNVTVALATYFPTPKPDVPHGTHGDVIVEVTIDEKGHIVDSKIAHSLGDSIDQTILATIQTWTFKPATKDGVAVPSEQELLFHYDRG